MTTLPQVTTQDPTRRALWLRLFGVDWLPVKAARPRWQVARGELVEGEILAFDLDAARLHPMARERFAHYIAQRTGETYKVAAHIVDGWPIAAAGCVVETAVSSEWVERPFTFSRGGAYATA
jgi:hypothetical protein